MNSDAQTRIKSDEILELIKVFSAVRDAAVREKIMTLIRAISASEASRHRQDN